MLFPRIPYLMEGATPTGSPAPAPAAPPAPAAEPATPAPAPTPTSTLPPDVAQRELADARKEAAAYRERLRQAEAKAEESRQAQLKEQGKYQELYEGEKKKTDDLSKQVSSYEAAFHAQVETEIATVPQQFRDLVPPGTDAQKLEWVRNAKARGLFGPAAAPTPSAAPPAPAVAPTGPAAAPPTATPAKPPKPTADEQQRYAYTRDPKERAELSAKISAWSVYAREHPGES